MQRPLIYGFGLFSVGVLACSSPASDAKTPAMAGSGNLGGASAAAGSAGLAMGGNTALATSGSAGSVSSSGASGAPAGGASTSGGGATGLSGGAGAVGSGGSGSSGGSGGNGAAGAGVAGGAPGGTIIVSDNFDGSAANGVPDASKWLPPPTGSTSGPTIVSSKAHSLPNSASSTGTSSGQGAALIPVSGLPTADNHFYVRAWINFAKATSAVSGHAAFLVAGSTLDQSGTELRLGVSIPPGFATAMVDLNLQNPKDGGGGEVTRFSNGFTTGGNPLNMAGTTFNADAWSCVEALFDGGHNEFRLWIGGTEVMNMHVTNFAARTTDAPRVMWAPSFKYLKIGAQNYSGDIGQVFYDDVIVSSAPIGCQ